MDFGNFISHCQAPSNKFLQASTREEKKIVDVQ